MKKSFVYRVKGDTVTSQIIISGPYLNLGYFFQSTKTLIKLAKLSKICILDRDYTKPSTKHKLKPPNMHLL